jgi:DNA polymerase-1
MSRNAGLKPPSTARFHDIRPQHHPLDSTYSTGLKQLATRYVDSRAAAAQHDLEEGIKTYGWANIPITFEPYWIYSAQDVVLTSQVDDVLRPRVLAECPKAYDLELSTMWVTDRMEHYGAHVDAPYARKAYDAFMQYIDTAEQWCRDTYGISPGSNQAVVNTLVSEGFEFTKKTASGLTKLDKDVLAGLDHPLAQTVLKRRQIQKLAKSYITHFLDERDSSDLIHCSINTLGPRTGRMSITNPALQTLPRFSEENAASIMVRNCISARPGHTLLMCDFDQIEMRVLAYLSKDPEMLDAFTSGRDFFISMACKIYRLEDMVKSDPRRTLTKNTCYGLAYGAGVAKLAQTSGAPLDAVQAFMRDFNAMYPQVPQYIRSVERDAYAARDRDGVASVRSPLTGRRHIGDKFKEYALVNYMIQGLAAELFKMKLLEIDASGLSPWMMLPVHDEIILDVPDEHVPDAVAALDTIMNDDRVIAPVPLTASVSYGQRWGDKREWGDGEEWRRSRATTHAA